MFVIQLLVYSGHCMCIQCILYNVELTKKSYILNVLHVQLKIQHWELWNIWSTMCNIECTLYKYKPYKWHSTRVSVCPHEITIFRQHRLAGFKINFCVQFFSSFFVQGICPWLSNNSNVHKKCRKKCDKIFFCLLQNTYMTIPVIILFRITEWLNLNILFWACIH